MPAHIFVMDHSNYDICLRRGVVGIPSAREGSRAKDSTNNALISRLCIVKESDYILFYITKEHKLYGIWQADGSPFLMNPVFGQIIYTLIVYDLKTHLIITTLLWNCTIFMIYVTKVESGISR